MKTSPETVRAATPVLLAPMLAADPDTVALVDARRELTWRQLAELVSAWMRLLHDRGVGLGDRVCCLLDNESSAFVVMLAALHTGVTIVPVNWHLTAREVAYIVTDSESVLLITNDRRHAVAVESIALVVASSPHVDLVMVESVVASGQVDLLTLQQTCGSTMMYTSGTTGAPKGVVNNLFVIGAPFAKVDQMGRFARTALGVQTKARMLLAGPWYHSAQLFFSLLSLLQGCRLVVQDAFDPVGLLALIETHRITSSHLVPTQFIRLLRLEPDRREAFSTSSLQHVWHGGGPCPQVTKRAMIDWWGPVLVEYYGATESGAITLVDSAEWLARPGTVGRALRPNELVVVDATGMPLSAGSVGRVFVRRGGGSRFSYHNAPEKTRDAHLDENTFTFGDIGHIDADGYLFLTGRNADLIVSGGVNIYPAEVEEVLRQHAAVRDVAVLGVPDEEFGESVAALVECEQQSAVADLIPALDAHARRGLAGFKVPRRYAFVEHIPREPSGKIRRDTLLQLAVAAGITAEVST